MDPSSWPNWCWLFHVRTAHTSTILSRLAMSTLHLGSLPSPMWCLCSSDRQSIFAFHLKVPKITRKVGSQWGFVALRQLRLHVPAPGHDRTVLTEREQGCAGIAVGPNWCDLCLHCVCGSHRMLCSFLNNISVNTLQSGDRERKPYGPAIIYTQYS